MRTSSTHNTTYANTELHSDKPYYRERQYQSRSVNMDGRGWSRLDDLTSPTPTGRHKRMQSLPSMLQDLSVESPHTPARPIALSVTDSLRSRLARTPNRILLTERSVVATQLQEIEVALREDDALSPDARRQLDDYAALIRDPFSNFNAVSTSADVLQATMEVRARYLQRAQQGDLREKNLLRELEAATKMDIYLKFGDYMAHRCRAITSKLSKINAPKFEYWTEVSDAIYLEVDEAMEREKEENRRIVPNGKWHKYLRDVAEMLNWSESETIKTVHEYAGRNSNVHGDIYEYLQRWAWDRFAERCQKHIDTLNTLLTRESQESDRVFYTECIQAFKDTFVRLEGGDGPSGHWAPTDMVSRAIKAGLTDHTVWVRISKVGKDPVAVDAKIKDIVGSLKQSADAKATKLARDPAAGAELDRNSIEYVALVHRKRIQKLGDELKAANKKLRESEGPAILQQMYIDCDAGVEKENPSPLERTIKSPFFTTGVDAAFKKTRDDLRDFRDTARE